MMGIPTRKFQFIFLLLTASYLGRCANSQPGQTELPPTMTWNQVPQVIGSLGKPVGTFIDLKGTTPGHSMMMDNPIYISDVDGQILDRPVLIQMPGHRDFRPGRTYEFRGYETGGYAGNSADPLHRGNDQPQKPFRFDVWLVATVVKE